MHILDKHLAEIVGGCYSGKAETTTKSGGLNINQICSCECTYDAYSTPKCACYCEDADTFMIQGEGDAGFLTRWLYYYPAAFFSGLFYNGMLRAGK